MSEENTNKAVDQVDPDRETTPGRGPGQGSWLEKRVAETLERWGYMTERRTTLLALQADVVARRKPLQGTPTDYLVVECKDYALAPVTKQAIIRLCLLAFIARAMPVLCHNSHLSDPAWELAQAYDVRVLNTDDLLEDRLPPLTTCRPPRGTTPHRQEQFASDFRSELPVLLWRPHPFDHDLEGPVFGPYDDPPCYVSDRTGHTEYVRGYESEYDFGE